MIAHAILLTAMLAVSGNAKDEWQQANREVEEQLARETAAEKMPATLRVTAGSVDAARFKSQSIELRLDGKPLAQVKKPKVGQVLAQANVAPGQHVLEVRMDGRGSSRAFRYLNKADVSMSNHMIFGINSGSVVDLRVNAFSEPGVKQWPDKLAVQIQPAGETVKEQRLAQLGVDAQGNPVAQAGLGGSGVGEEDAGLTSEPGAGVGEPLGRSDTVAQGDAAKLGKDSGLSSEPPAGASTEQGSVAPGEEGGAAIAGTQGEQRRVQGRAPHANAGKQPITGEVRPEERERHTRGADATIPPIERPNGMMGESLAERAETTPAPAPWSAERRLEGSLDHGPAAGVGGSGAVVPQAAQQAESRAVRTPGLPPWFYVVVGLAVVAALAVFAGARRREPLA